MTRRVVSSSVTDADRFQLKSYVIGTTAAPGVARLDPRALRTICALATSTTQRTHDEIKICWLNLVGACLVCGLVVCAVWLRCPCHVLGWVEHWRDSWSHARVMSQTGISRRYRMHCSSGLRFCCQAWKPCMVSPLPRLALGRGRGGLAALLLRLVC